MMRELFNLGLTENDIINMIEINQDLKELTDEEILEKIKILKNINCSDNQIKNIISSNVLYLSRSNSDIVKLFKYLLNFIRKVQQYSERLLFRLRSESLRLGSFGSCDNRVLPLLPPNYFQKQLALEAS